MRKDELDFERLDSLAAANATIYQNNDPFPHIVIDNFLNADLLEEARQEIEAEGSILWQSMDDRYQKKMAFNRTRQMGPKTRALINSLNGQDIILFLEKLTGIEGLVTDPGLAGGGVHMLRPGGFLGVHADFNLHRGLRLDRRLNLLVYLNHDWQEEYGGLLELWDKKMTRPVKKIVPLFNRCVIFSTTENSFHGNPEPVNTPDGRDRKSLALYYYTNGRPTSELANPHMTNFQYRPGEASAYDRGKRIAKRLVPPIISEWLDMRR